MRSATGYQVIGCDAAVYGNQPQESRCSRLTVPSCSADLGQDNLIGAKSIIGTLAVQVGSCYKRPVAPAGCQDLRPLTYQLSAIADVACPGQWWPKHLLCAVLKGGQACSLCVLIPDCLTCNSRETTSPVPSNSTSSASCLHSMHKATVAHICSC